MFPEHPLFAEPRSTREGEPISKEESTPALTELTSRGREANNTVLNKYYKVNSE